MTLMALMQTVYCQNIPRSKAKEPVTLEGKLQAYRFALVNCDNKLKECQFDYKLALESDSTKGELIKSKNKRISNDSLLVLNLRAQLDNSAKQLVNSMDLYKNKKPKFRTYTFVGVGGIIVGYIIRKELQSMLLNLAK
jgi:hypothetical protein